VFDGKGIAQCEAWGDNDGATGDTVCAVDPISNTCAGCNVLDQKACDTTNCAVLCFICKHQFVCNAPSEAVHV
jgi:hypothetical protein